MVASRQAIDLDKEKIRLDAKVIAIKRELNTRVGERLKLEDQVKHLEFEVNELRNLVEEL